MTVENCPPAAVESESSQVEAYYGRLRRLLRENGLHMYFGEYGDFSDDVMIEARWRALWPISKPLARITNEPFSWRKDRSLRIEVYDPWVEARMIGIAELIGSEFGVPREVVRKY